MNGIELLALICLYYGAMMAICTGLLYGGYKLTCWLLDKAPAKWSKTE
jgi:hypothetical protein